jgi:hypothetical protein
MNAIDATSLSQGRPERKEIARTYLRVIERNPDAVG